MKKYSANKHHTLTELNITPLLDLAFVLLVIFIITTAPPVNDINIALPTATRYSPRGLGFSTVADSISHLDMCDT